MASLNPVHKDIIFKFKDNVSRDGDFKQETDWGFKIVDDAPTGGDAHRIVEVLAVGPECEHVKPGMTVIVEALMWTNQFDIRGRQCWKTDESKIIALVE